MKVYTNIQDFKNVNNPIVTTGTFDGVHIGHRRIINRISEIAKAEHGETVILTFFPHPRMVLFPDDNDLRLINSQKEKIMLLEDAGVDHLIIYPFTREFSRLTAVEYVRDILVNQIGVKKLVIGYDHHFGRNREGDLEQLKEFAPLYDFEVEEIPAQDIDDVRVSSTKVRHALLEGDMKTANKYLQYEFLLNGIVIEGSKVGRSIGFPTANLHVVEDYKLIPADGVYVVKVRVKEQWHYGMINIGYRPTINGDEAKKSIEVHIFNFNEEIYGEVITLSFLQRLRDEEKFESVEALQRQLANDKEKAQQLVAVYES